MLVFGVENHGEVARQRQAPCPEPGPGEVRLKVSACALNHADLLLQDGRYQERPPLPLTLGMEVCGIVAAHGPGVEAPALGTRVAVFIGHGGLAEQCLAPAAACLNVPDTVSDGAAAAFQVTYGTAHLGLAYRAALRPGERIMVLGASGGAGLTAVEVAAGIGAQVIAVARGAEKLGIARTAGATDTIDSAAPDLGARLKAAGPVDVVYDTVGEPAAAAALRACRPGARYLVIGFAGGEVPQLPANYLLVKNLTVHGLSWSAYRTLAPDVMADSLRTLMGWLAEGRISPHIGATLPLARAGEGLEMLRRREATGKIVITP